MKPLTTMVVLAGLVFMAAPPALAQENPNGPPGPRAKVAAVNIGLLFTKYEKAAAMKKELEADLQPLKAKAEKIKAEMKEADDIIASKTAPPEAVASAQDRMLSGKRMLEDLDRQARKQIGKKQETQLVELWVDIKSAIAEHAKARDFDIVLGYGDPPDQDPDTFTNINRKMTGIDMGGVTPIYIRNGADISVEVLTRLNDGYRSQRKAPDAKAPDAKEGGKSDPSDSVKSPR